MSERHCIDMYVFAFCFLFLAANNVDYEAEIFVATSINGG